MLIKIPQNIITTLQPVSNKHQLYLVGGALRDLLLHLPVKDWDFATSATPAEIQTLIPRSHYNNRFGTVTIPLPDTQTIIEITTMRLESNYTDQRHPQAVDWTDQIELDLARRDFTINALAYNLSSNQLIDPFAGQKDLENSIVRSVNNPDNRFREDALRMLRAVRFAVQLGFIIEPLTLESITKNSSLIQNIASERVRDELLKIIASPHPYEGIVLLRNTKLLSHILPELERCFSIEQTGPKHDREYNIGEHSLLTLKACRSLDPIIRFACLLHDIGKPDTYHIAPDGNTTFYNHEVVGAKIAQQICQRLHFTNQQTSLITSLIRWHMFSVDEKQTDSAIRRIIRHIGIDNLDNLFILREADRIGGGTKSVTSWRLENLKERIRHVLTKPFSITDLKVNGQDVMEILRIPPSKQVGIVLDQLFSEVENDLSKNTRRDLLERLRHLAKSSQLTQKADTKSMTE